MPTSVALISAVNPYPSDAGKKVVLAGFVEYLAARVGAHNVHYVMVGGDHCRAFPVTLRPVDKPSGSRAVASLLTRTLTGRSSMQEALLNTPDLRDAIYRALRDIKPDLEIFDTVRMAQHARISDARAVCYLDDLFSERYRGMLEAAKRYPGIDLQPMGNFGVHVPAVVRPIAEWRQSQHALLRLEQRLVRRSENRVARDFDTTLLINAHEAALLRSRTGLDGKRIHAIPPLLTNRPLPVRRPSAVPEFVFLGQLSLTHNDDGLGYFLTEIWPLVLAQRPDVRLRVIGRDPRPGLISLVAQYADSVTLEGFVPELGGLLSRAVALVNPLRFGSGIKLKIIEALGAGLPVVSTSIGADGVASGADRGVVVGDSVSDFARFMLESSDAIRNAELSAAAQEHFDSCYSRRAVFARYDTVFGLG